MSPQELLNTNGITLQSYAPGRYYTTCPQCSQNRTKTGHKNFKCLGVTITDDGRVMWGCNHCQWSGPEKGTGERRSAEDLISYIYRGRDGVVSFRKVRNRPGKQPRFWLERSDGKGGWVKGATREITWIIYRKDEVDKAIRAGGTIAVVEGEKDADNLWHLGIAATCNAHGASEPGKKSKWTDLHSQQLAGADIIVFNDNDAPGYAHADTVCKLSLGVAKRVRRLDLKDHWSGISEGGDISDWLAIDGHTPERLRELIKTAPDVAAPAPGPEPPIDVDAELERLAKLSMFEYERGRTAAAEKLKLRAAILDKLVFAKRAELGLGEQDDGKQGHPLKYDEPEPWPEPVDGAQLLDEIAAAVLRFMILPKLGDIIAALWVVHTYLLDLQLMSPRLQISAPDSECGKSTLLDVMHALVRRAQWAVNLTPAVTFRLVDRFQPTILLDEADATLPTYEDLRSILDSGHHPRGEVPRLVGDEYEPRGFRTYGAVAFALIGRLGGKLRTLDSRSVVIRLERKRANQIVESFDATRSPAELLPLKRRVIRWVHDHRQAIADARVETTLSNRRADNWRILLQIAEVAGGDWPKHALAAAMAPGELAQSQLEELLSDVRRIFAANEADTVVTDKGDKFINSTRLAEALAAIDGHSWAEYDRSGKPLTANKLARLLKRVEIIPRPNSDASARGYHFGYFAEALATYLPAAPGVSKCQAVRNADGAGTSRDSKVSETPPSSDTLKAPPYADEIETSDDLTLWKGGNGQMRAGPLDAQVIPEIKEWAIALVRRHWDVPDRDALLDQALRERLFNKYDVFPGDLEAAVALVMDAVFRT
jgi:putative DNA primase/helicase